jgi:small subunit ribosomal protein S17e
MGRIRTHDVKKVSFELVERYGNRLNNEFQNNKEVVEELKIANSKRVRNRSAGYVTRIAKRRK